MNGQTLDINVAKLTTSTEKIMCVCWGVGSVVLVVRYSRAGRHEQRVWCFVMQCNGHDSRATA